ncbi:cupin domain-containing protein [Trueperella sp. LYQ143]|uniref:cupin domain-containing protein n=1 Tax=Trueperella sp. LYQ143 TaxID=3391059 RepID=UPI0039832682
MQGSDLTREEVIALLNLAPLEGEGGFYRQTYADKNSTAIYFLVGGDAFSVLHRLTGQETYHWYGGAPLEIFTIDPQGNGCTRLMGMDLPAGQVPQLVVPAGYWQGSRSSGSWTLVGTTMAPGYTPEGFELATEKLIAQYPQYECEIRRLLPVE